MNPFEFLDDEILEVLRPVLLTFDLSNYKLTLHHTVRNVYTNFDFYAFFATFSQKVCRELVTSQLCQTYYVPGIGYIGILLVLGSWTIKKHDVNLRRKSSTRS